MVQSLQRIDRVLFELTIRVVDNIRSAKLAKIINMLTRKLEDAIKNEVFKAFKTNWLLMAQKTSSTAQKLGNKSAKVLGFRLSFAVSWLLCILTMLAHSKRKNRIKNAEFNKKGRGKILDFFVCTDAL